MKHGPSTSVSSTGCVNNNGVPQMTNGLYAKCCETPHRDPWHCLGRVGMLVIRILHKALIRFLRLQRLNADIVYHPARLPVREHIQQKSDHMSTERHLQERSQQHYSCQKSPKCPPMGTETSAVEQSHNGMNNVQLHTMWGNLTDVINLSKTEAKDYVLYNSIYMKYKNRLNYPMVGRVRTV